MKLSFLLPLCFLACTSLPGSQPSTECLGAESASNMIVYLHGMDIPAKSAQEIQNREKLLRIASKTNSRVALPRALRRCPGTVDQICWGWSFNDNELADIKQSIQSAATQCGAPPHYVIVGFSNGGYGINRLFENAY